MGHETTFAAGAGCFFGIMLVAVGLVAVTGSQFPLATLAGWGLALVGFGVVGAGIVLLATSDGSSV